MAWHWTGNSPFPEPMMTRFTRPQWVNDNLFFLNTSEVKVHGSLNCVGVGVGVELINGSFSKFEVSELFGTWLSHILLIRIILVTVSRGPFTSQHGWVITCSIKCGMKLLIYSQTSTVAWLLIHFSKRGPRNFCRVPLISVSGSLWSQSVTGVYYLHFKRKHA